MNSVFNNFKLDMIIFNLLNEIKNTNNKICISELLKIYYKYKDLTNDNIDYSQFLIILINNKIIELDDNMEYFIYKKNI